MSDMPDFKELATALPLNKNTLELQGIEEWIKNILAAVSYHDGFAHTEFIVTEEGFEVVEINPRLGGGQIGEALCKAFNTNIYKGFLECALGREPELLQKELIPQTFIGQALIYAKTTGKFQQISLKHAGRKQTTLYPCALQGKEILNLRDQSAYVSILLTTGTISETALLNALSEANKVNLVVEKLKCCVNSSLSKQA
ncbi:hypothetical protein MCQ_01288 [Candidatus Bartonella washoeensis Sb944nv]|uniref:ATP-grasp domain-containing protein n=2 Tax=Candidatus Bartonella washoeensis TaxID=186739 RepID=J0Q748_9HYPH|nr:hypothetical protein MCQ_01288 [Bartonella washoeensis Sb944nv]